MERRGTLNNRRNILTKVITFLHEYLENVIFYVNRWNDHLQFQFLLYTLVRDRIIHVILHVKNKVPEEMIVYPIFADKAHYSILRYLTKLYRTVIKSGVSIKNIDTDFTRCHSGAVRNAILSSDKSGVLRAPRKTRLIKEITRSFGVNPNFAVAYVSKRYPRD